MTAGQRPERPPSPGERTRPGSAADHGPASGSTTSPAGRPPDDDARIAPRDREALEASVRSVGGGRRGATLAAVLVVAAFLVGLVRPWDWIGGRAADDSGPQPRATAAALVPGAGDAFDTAGPPASGGTSVEGGDAAAAQTCAYPQSWRSATVQLWAGRLAHVWTAVDAATATGPLDPSIPFQPIAGDQFTAIGWCAPVLGPDRPPETARGRLFRIVAGAVSEPAFRRLEPAAPNALGELWVPATAAGAGGAAVVWPAGRYVIELATASGSWTRFIGIELRVTPQPGASPKPSGSTGPSPSGP
jgi:hypothetical protein